MTLQFVKKCMLLTLLVAMPALATPPDTARFYDFGALGIDSQAKHPATLYLESHQRARFERLLSLKKSMREPLRATAQDPTLH